MEDLSLGTYTVTQVAEKYNFNSLSCFNRRYKKYCGTAPMTTLTEAKKEELQWENNSKAKLVPIFNAVYEIRFEEDYFSVNFKEFQSRGLISITVK